MLHFVLSEDMLLFVKGQVSVPHSKGEELSFWRCKYFTTAVRHWSWPEQYYAFKSRNKESTARGLSQVEMAQYSTSPVLAELGSGTVPCCRSTPTIQVTDDLQQSTLLWVRNAQNLQFSLSAEENHELLNYFQSSLSISLGSYFRLFRNALSARFQDKTTLIKNFLIHLIT